MALWQVRQGGEVRTGLTIYQVQGQIASGDLNADAEVSPDGVAWQRIAEHPVLAKALPREEPTDASDLVVPGLVLERGADGKLLPPSSQAVEEFLAKHRTLAGKTTSEMVSSATRVAIAIISIVVTIACAFLMHRLIASGAVSR